METSTPFTLFVIGPQIVMLVTALLVLLVGLFLPEESRGRIAWLSLAGVLIAAGLLYYLWDGRDRTLSTMFLSDGISLFLNLVILTAAALAILFSVEYAGRMHLPQPEYYTLLLLSTTGMMLMSAAVNLIPLFLALEILSIALYALVGLNRAEQRSGEAAVKYFLLGAFSSGFLLYGIALVYGQVGTTALDEIRAYLLSTNAQSPALLWLGLGLMLIGFGFKVALVPFHMWTPDVYQGAPTSVTAFMSVGTKVAGFAALGRVVLYAFSGLPNVWTWVLAVLAALTMTVGNLAALRQTNLKRMLAYSSIAHAGYILVGLAAANRTGMNAVLFYLFIYAFMNIGAFAILIAANRLGMSAEAGERLDDLVGLAERKPWLAAAMALLMFSLTGVPPLAGFLGKLYLFSAAVEAGLLWLAILGILNSVVSAYYYVRVVIAMYMGEGKPAELVPAPLCPALQLGIAATAIAVVLWGLWPAWILNLITATTRSLFGG
ncbi:MAG: NADH-quinone oxidoreductase subunit N [Anaerolineae bacterium]